MAFFFAYKIINVKNTKKHEDKNGNHPQCTFHSISMVNILGFILLVFFLGIDTLLQFFFSIRFLEYKCINVTVSVFKEKFFSFIDFTV